MFLLVMAVKLPGIQSCQEWWRVAASVAPGEQDVWTVESRQSRSTSYSCLLRRRKETLKVPRKILLELLRELQAEGREQQDLHIELLKLRHNWMLRKVGSNILDDLSYSKQV